MKKRKNSPMTSIFKWTLALSLAFASVGAREALSENTSGVAMLAQPKFKKSDAATYGK